MRKALLLSYMYSLSVGVATVKLGEVPEKDANVSTAYGNSPLALMLKILRHRAPGYLC